MPQDKKFVPGKGMVPAGKAAGGKKEAVPPKKGAVPPKKEAPGKGKAVPPKPKKK